ncbi:uncharacterized protein J3D65DRAFT_613812 [Phyllosticta citribraziliensis]|uniref:Uncharacterized protein n=1 Tax=Phyllosticta citribraziliensis TaxID=989973 RepID=A0ABR1M4D1_9PEZI
MAESTVPLSHGNGEHDAQLPDAPMSPQDATATNGTADSSMDIEMKEEPVEANVAPANVPPAQNTITTSTSDIPTTSPPPAQFAQQPPPPQQAAASSTALPTTTSPPPAPAAAATSLPTASTNSASTPTSTATAMPPRDQRAESATRTGSPRPGQQQAQQQLPREALPHGSPTRVYLNSHLTPYLLEGMKKVAVLEPEKPLKWLSDFLAEKSKEVEGTGTGNEANSG